MSLARLLFPKSIAVVGGKPAAEVIRQNDRLGFTGPIWPVHPSRAHIENRPALRAVDDLPDAPDAVFLAVNRHATLDLVARLARRGAGGVICYASGFAETDAEGAELQRRLREAAGAMPLLGPNCYGTINYLDGSALWPDQHGGTRVGRGVAIITQSGNIGCNLTMQRRALPIAYLATLGNQAVIGLSALIAALSDDPRITAIGLHIEAIDDPAAFAAAVSLAATRGIRVVAVKTGVSAAGAALTVSHTASMTSADAIADAFLRRVGVARVRALPELIEALKLLHVHGTLQGPDIGSMSCSGGEAALFADRAEGRRVRFRPLTPSQTAAVAATVPALVSVSNPFDYHTFHWANGPALGATFAAFLRADFALTALVLDFPRADRCDDADWRIAADALRQAAHATGRPTALVATLAECLPEADAARCIAAGVAPLCGLDEALAAIEAALPHPPGPLLAATTPVGRVRTLDEREGKARLAAFGVSIPGQGGFPAVAKALGIDHKSERSAVRLNLADAASVAAAARDLAGLGTGVLIEDMVLDPVAELIVGVARDRLGLCLLLGSGGILAELIGDHATLMLPASRQDIHDALRGLRAATLLAGHRGRPAGAIDAAIAAILAIQAFAVAHADRLIELDVNPLIVTPDRAVAADALIRLTEPD
jgi:acyl-CoA synthetase (NDP forming)